MVKISPPTPSSPAVEVCDIEGDGADVINFGPIQISDIIAETQEQYMSFPYSEGWSLFGIPFLIHTLKYRFSSAAVDGAPAVVEGDYFSPDPLITSKVQMRTFIRTHLYEFESDTLPLWYKSGKTVFDSKIQIVKDNDASVYWPQFDFNGIPSMLNDPHSSLTLCAVVNNTNTLTIEGDAPEIYLNTPVVSQVVSNLAFQSGTKIIAYNPSTKTILLNKTYTCSGSQANVRFYIDKKYEGYQIRTLINYVIKYHGIPQHNEDANTYNLSMNFLPGWNQKSFPSMLPINAEVFFEPLGGDLQIVKANNASIYWPEFQFNNIHGDGNLRPGQGYQIRLYTE